MKILQPGKISKMELKNRIMFAPMGSHIDNFGPGTHNYFLERAKGGTGLIVIPIFATEAVEYGSPSLILDEDSFGAATRLIEEIHLEGAKVCMQMVPGYGRISPGAKNYSTPVSASAVPALYNSTVICHELTKDEIKMIQDGFRETARLAKEAGADSIEIHAYGGYLTDQFLSVVWNKRNDECGGDLKGRARFLLELVEIVKDVCGEDYPLIVKYTPAHYMQGEGYRTIDEGIELSKLLEEAGVHLLHIDAGCHERSYLAMPPIYQQEQTYQLRSSEAVKKAVSIPVATNSKFGDLEKAETALQQGKTDFLMIGRGLLADPYLSIKLAEYRADDIAPCIGCNESCIGNVVRGKGIACTVNPEVGREGTMKVGIQASSKKILVIGGGPGGMQAAIDAAKAGHDVALWEKATSLGGMLIAAGRPSFKLEINRLIDYYRTQILKLGVKVKLGMEATAESVLEYGADAVVIATGAKPLIPAKIPGIDGSNVVTAIDAMLDKSTLGQNIVMIGGGLVGCETALYLTSKGKQITMIEMQPKLLPEPIFYMNEIMLTEMIHRDQNIMVQTGTKLLSINETGIEVEKDGQKTNISCDTVVLAMGLTPENTLAKELEGKAPFYIIGDCFAPRKITEAVLEARETILSLQTTKERELQPTI